MSDNFEHNPGDHEDPLSGATWLVGFVGIVLLVIIMMGLTALFYNVQDEQVAENFMEPKDSEITQLREKQAAVLRGSYRYVQRIDETVTDRETTYDSIVIPIDEAILKIVQEYGDGR